MENWEQFANKILELMQFREYRVEIDHEHRHGAIFIYDHPTLIKEHLPMLVESINHLAQLVAKRNTLTPIFFDLNNYRQERQNLIVELARAAAKKALATKTDVSLPAMNSYERRLVHVELAIHPEVTTESVGSGHERYVIIRPIKDEKQNAQSVL